MEHPNARIARRLWDATSEGDADAIREILAPDVRWHSYDSGILSGEFHGPDAVVDRLARSGDACALHDRRTNTAGTKHHDR